MLILWQSGIHVHSFVTAVFWPWWFSYLKDEAKRTQDRLHADLSVIKVKLRELEAQNERLTAKSCEVKQNLKEHVDIDEERYYELRCTADDMLSVKDLVAVLYCLLF